MATTTIDAWDELAAADPALADEFMARVALGAELLDQRKPGWAAMVNLDRLAMESCDDCILGQVYGHYFDGRAELELSIGEPLGFSLRARQLRDHMSAYDALAALWRRQVRSRLAAAGEVARG